MPKTYIKKDGTESVYDNKKYKRNEKIYKLQKLKSYYKKKGDMAKVEGCEILINLEKRRAKNEI